VVASAAAAALRKRGCAPRLADSLDAWRLTLHGGPAPSAAGFSGEQLFFLAFAQSWRQKFREPELRRRIVIDGHAPAEYRADTVRNLDAW
jgi:putative endopeptidase